MRAKIFLSLAFILCLLTTSCMKQKSSVSPEHKILEGQEKLVGFTPLLKDGNFYVYKNSNERSFFAPSGWMGDYGDIKMDYSCKDNPYSEPTCLRFEYSAKKTQQQGWAGVYWQNPANNWGDKKGGYNLTGAKRLTFYARGEKGGEIIAEFKVGGIFQGEYPDSSSNSIGPIVLTKHWKKYTIELKGLDLSYINGGFCWVATANDNPEGCIFYLDDIQYEFQ